ncbi:MAG: hypothetical protein LBC02_13305 [Planctomycetaceae bacterium]|nr:hypothetical protein [Planctomycetaceae bacterium]
MNKTTAFLHGVLSVFDFDFDPTVPQRMPKPFSNELAVRLYNRFNDPRYRTMLPVWDGVDQSLQSAINEYERTHHIDKRSQNHNEQRTLETG